MDILKIRYPENEKTTYIGKLLNLAEKPSLEGFLISDFTTQTIYRFVATEEFQPNQKYPLHFSEEQPIIYSKEEYLEYAGAFLQELKEKKFLKAVFSRVKDVPFDTTETEHLFDQLCDEYPDAFVYLISSEKIGTWVGASPEYVLERMGKEIYTMSLAGTKKSLQEEWTQKELLEQEYVTKFIEDSLRNIKVKQLKSIGPFDYQAGPVTHLKTDIYAETEIGTLELALFLHPTPAVSGLPKMEAIELIGKHERHDRSIYTGLIGFYSPQSCSLYVNLRCTQIQKDHAYLYLGGGFTKDSILEKEWEETENKSKTLINSINKLLK